MISTKKEVQILAALMLDKGITDVVISPGSRNAPLINTFDGLQDFNCYTIVDERSAAFFAMGMALRLKRAVAVVCTSGSALLNYAPAVAEAFYQKIPLLILSADRPREWVDQGDGQTIRQENALQNVVKKSVSLTGGMRDEQEEWCNTRLLNEAINALTYPECGPVHINMPFSEPLYDLVNEDLPKAKSISLLGLEVSMSVTELSKLKQLWTDSTRKMILVAQLNVDIMLNDLLSKLAERNDVVVLSEKTSNINSERVLSSIDNVVSASEKAELAPDLLITIGGQVVSKKIKSFLRANKPNYHWHFSSSMEIIDTYMCLTDVIVSDPVQVLKCLNEENEHPSSYVSLWHDLDKKARELNAEFASSLEFCDFKVFESIFQIIPAESTLHLSNSTPVRYAQLFPMKNVVCQSNRGTSGIDGVVSTAAGYALVDKGLNVLLVGDLSFFYDSNALWNQHFPKNLKIVLINNGGGGIFRFISGPSSMPALEKHFVAKHRTQAEGLVRGFGLNYDVANNLSELKYKFKQLIADSEAGVLEVFTPEELNAQVLRNYFKFLKESN